MPSTARAPRGRTRSSLSQAFAVFHHDFVDDREFGTLDDAYHAVFMRRVHDLLES